MSGICTERGTNETGRTRKGIDNHSSSGDSGGVDNLRIDQHRPARTGRHHPHRLRHLCGSDLFDVRFVNAAAAGLVRDRCGAVRVLGYDSVLEQVRRAGGVQQPPDNGHLLLRPADSVAHRGYLREEGAVGCWVCKVIQVSQVAKPKKMISVDNL